MADGVGLPVGHVRSSSEQTIKLPYFTAEGFDLISPSSSRNGNHSVPNPLVIMLSGYCLPAKQQDDVRSRPHQLSSPPRRATQPATRRPCCARTAWAFRRAGASSPQAANNQQPADADARVCVPAQMQLQYAKQVDEKQFHYVMLKSARSTRNCSLCPTTIRAANAAGNMPFYAAGAGLTQALTSAGLCTAWDACPACCVNENAGRNGGDTGYIKSVIAAVSAAVAVDSKARAGLKPET